MACRLPYIDEAPISEEEKDRLSAVHDQIYEHAEESKVFRKENGKLYAYKNRFGEATKFVADMKEAFGGKQVVKLVKEGLSKFKLAINTLPLKAGEQRRLFPSQASEIKYVATPRMAELFREGNELKSSEVLAKIARRPDYMGKLAGKLLENLHTDVNIRLMSASDALEYIKKHEIETGPDFDITKLNGFYTDSTNEIVILARDNNNVDNTINHEVIHALTHQYLEGDATFAKEFRNLMEEIKSQLTPEEISKYEHELSNPHEFLTGAFTSGRLQELLATKPSMKDPEISVWGQFKDWLHNKLAAFMGLDPKQRTLLHDVLDHGANVISDSKYAEQVALKVAKNSINPQLTPEESEKIKDEILAHEQKGFTKSAQDMFNLLDRQTRRKAFDAIEHLFMKGEINQAEELKKNIEEVYKKTEKGKRLEQAAIGFARGLDQLNYVATSLVDSLRNTDWASLPDNEALGKILNHTQYLNEWQVLADNLRSEFPNNPGIKKVLDKLDGTLKDAKLFIDGKDSPLKEGVVNRLTDILEPAQKRIQAEYDEAAKRLQNVIDNKIKRGDTEGAKIVQGMLDERTEAYKKIKVEKSDILEFLTGLRGDTNGGSAWLEAMISSPDPITAAVAMDLKTHYDKATENSNDFDLKFQQEISGYLKSLGAHKLGIFNFWKQFVQEESYAEGEKRVELLNQFTGWQGKLEELNKAVDEARLSGDEAALRAARIARREFALKYMHQEFDPEVYKRYEIFSDKLGEEAKHDREDIFEELNEIRLKQSEISSEGDDLTPDEELHIEHLLNKYRQLASLTNIDGTEKTGDAKIKAEKQKEYNEATKKFYDWVEIPGEFERKRKQVKDGLLNQFGSADDPQYKAELAAWDRRNLRIIANKQFYEDRQKIINRLAALTKLIKDKGNSKVVTDFEQGWKKILEQTYGFRDADGQPVGSDMSFGKLEAVKEQQQKMEELKKNIEGLSGLSSAENDELQKIWAFIKAKVKLTPEQTNRKTELEAKRKNLGLDEKDKTAFYKALEELQEIQSRIPTDYYVMELNKMAALHGKVYDTDTAIDLLNSHELDELRQNPTFEAWFQRNHLEVERWNPDINMKEKQWERTYVWNRVVPNDPAHLEHFVTADGDFLYGKPNLKYYKREVKPQYKTDKIVGTTVDNRGRWLPRGYDKAGNLTAHDDTYINKAYDKLKNSADPQDKIRFKLLDAVTKKHLEVQDKLPSNSGRMWMEIPRDQKTLSELVQTGDFKGAMGKAGEKIFRLLPIPKLFGDKLTKTYQTVAENKEKENFGKRTVTVKKYNPETGSYSYEKQRATPMDNILINIPVKYTGYMDPNQVSLDIPGAISKYHMSVETKAQLSQTIPFVKAVESILNSHKFLDKDKMPSLDAYKRLENIRNLQDKYYNGIYKRGIFSKNRDASSAWVENNIIRPITKLGSIAIIAADYPRAAWSMISWNMYSLFDAIGNRTFSLADFALAMRDYHTKLLPAWIADSTQELGKKSFYGQLFDMVNPTNESRHLVGQRFTGTLGGTALHNVWEAFMNPTRFVQHQVDASITMAILRNTHVKENGNSISMLDAFEMGPDGILRQKAGVNISKEKLSEVRERIRQAIRDTQGNYGSMDAAQIEQYGYGQVLMFMHRFIVPLAMDAYQGNRFNISYGNTEGYYRTGLKFMRLGFESIQQKTNLLKTMTPTERGRVYKGIAFMASTVAFLSILAYMKMNRNISYKNYKYRDWEQTMAMLMSYRVMAETSQMNPAYVLGELGGLAEKPFITSSILAKIGRLLGDIRTEGVVQAKKAAGMTWREHSGKRMVDPRVITSADEKRMYRDLYGTDRRVIVDIYKMFGYKGGGLEGQIPFTNKAKKVAASRLVTAATAMEGR